jgi:hypothetical protein
MLAALGQQGHGRADMVNDRLTSRGASRFPLRIDLGRGGSRPLDTKT